MNRTILNLFLVLTLCLSCQYVHAAGTVTVYDGTTENSYVPACLSFLDASYQHSQFLIPAASLTSANNQALSSMQFYLNTAASDACSNSWVITLMETTASSVSGSYKDVSAGTMVYSGTIDWRTTTPIITFDVPYTYHGGNLLVDMRYSNSPNADYIFSSFLGTTTSGRSIIGMDYSSEPTTVTSVSFSPKTTFTYTTPSSCTAPQGLRITSLTSSSVSASWNATGASQYQYLVVLSGQTPSWSSASYTSSTSCSVSGLDDNETYDLYVRSFCSASSLSAGSKVLFHTLCASTTPELLGTVGFETSEGFLTGLGNLNGTNCWSAGNAGSSDASYIPYVVDYDAHTGSNAISINARKDVWVKASNAYFALPEMDFAGNISQYEISFYAKKASDAYLYDTLLVGVMTDPTDVSTFTQVGFVVVSSTTYNGYSVSLSSYTGSGSYLAIMTQIGAKAAGTAKYAGFFIDDITVSTTPSCRPLANVALSDITRTSVRVDWQKYADMTNCYSYQLICTTRSTPSTGTDPVVTIAVTQPCTYTFTNLNRNTHYYVHLRSDCGPLDGQSEWITTDFTTLNLEPDCSSSTPDTLVTGSSVIEYIPWGEGYNSYYSQQLVTADELTALGMSAGYVGKVGFQYVLSSSYTKDVTIYMGSTSITEMTTSFLPVTKCSEPVQTTFSTPGVWYEFDLVYPFYWDGVSNVVVGMLSVGENHPSYQESNAFMGGSKSNASLYSNSDYGNPDMTTGFLSSYRANMAISICPLETSCPAPATLEATDVRPNSAVATWSPSEGDYANTYDLYYSTTPVTSFSSITPKFQNITDTFKTITGLSANTTYYYYVRTRCNARSHDEGRSDWSEAGVFTTDLACATPDAFVAERVYSTSADLRWKNVNGSDAWKIYLSGASSSTVSVDIDDCTVKGDTIRYTLTGLSPLSSYQLQLKADCGSQGMSNYAEEIPEFTTLNNAVGFSSFTVTNADVTSPVVIDQQANTVTASLRMNTDRSDIAFVAEYLDTKCIARVGNLPFTSPADFTSPLTVRIFAEDTTVFEDWVVNLYEESCATPYDISVSNIERRSVTLDWSLGDALATTFDVVASTTPLSDPATGSLHTVTATNVGGSCSYTVTGLDRSTYYYAYIRTNCGSTRSQWRSTEFTTASLDPGEPACPGVTDVIASAIDEYSVDVNWTACSGDYANTSDIYYTTHDTTGITLVPQITGISGTSAQITGLTTYTLYHIYVRTRCNGEGHDDGYSRWVGTDVRTHAPCRVPANITSTLTSKNSVVLSWDNVSTSPAQADLYTYIFSATPIPAASLDYTIPTATGYTSRTLSLNNLTTAATYHFYIRNDCGTSLGGSPWDSCSFTMPDPLPAVIELEASDITHNAFTATWSSDTSLFADETEWEVAVVRHGTTPSSEWTVTTSREYYAVGLQPETTYDLYVRAKSGSQHSASTMISVTTSYIPTECITLFDDGDISSGSPFVPVQYDYYTKVNTVIPASELTQLAGKDIDSLTFYIDLSEPETTSATVQIYLQEVSYSTVTTPASLAGATLVYTGSFDFSKVGPVSLPLNAPFHYNGGNLLIATQNISKDNYVEAYFAGDDTQGSYGYGVSASSLSSITSFRNVGAFMPKTTFCFRDETFCRPVYNLTVTDLTSVSASVHWYAGNLETEWHFINSTVPLSESELESASYVTLTTPRYDITGLVQDNDYYIYVRGVCSATENSDWVEYGYSTPAGGNVYTISAVADPAVCGSVSLSCSAIDTTADGRFYQNSTPTLTASARYGFSFTHWASAVTGNVLSTSNPWTITASHDSLLIARFDTISYNLNVSVAPGYEPFGSVAGGGSYHYQSTRTFSATPNPHYHVVWNDGDTSRQRTVVMPASDTSFTAFFYPNLYTLTATPNDISRGTVTGGGVYNYGDTAILVAKANYPYTFSRWTDVASTTTDTLRFVVHCDTAITGIFKYNEYDVVVNTNDGTMGTVSGAGVYQWGTTAALTATPAPHHHLVRWSNGATTLAINPTIVSDTTFTAYFAIDSFNVHVTANSSAMGSVTGSGRYPYGAVATLTATPSAHHTLSSWSNGVTTPTQTVTVTSDSVIVANFAVQQFNVSLSITNPALGSVTGAGIYNYGSDVTVTFTPLNSHCLFNGWSNGATALSTLIHLTSDTTLVADVVLDSHTITANVNDPAMGSVSGAGTYTHGTSVTLIATPVAHHHFVSWSNGVKTPLLTLVADADSTLTATFAIDSYNLALDVSNPALGSVTGAGTYDYGTDVTISAAVKGTHSIFNGWNNGITTASAVIHLTSDSFVVANFIYDSHTLTALVNDPAMGSVSGAGTYTHGSSVTLTAIPADHYHFVSWDNGVTTPSLTLTLDTDSTVTAYFAVNSHVITALPNDTARGSVTGAGTYNYGDTAILIAKANYPYTFSRWNDPAATTTDTLVHIVRGDTSLTAIFKYIEVDVVARTNDASMGSASGSGNYVWGSTVTLTAQPALHHHLVRWSNGATSNSITVTVTSDTIFTAILAIDSFYVSGISSDISKGSVSGSGRYPYNEVANLVATPVANHHFVSWNNGSTAASTYIIVTRDTNLVANFAIDRHNLSLAVNDASLGSVTGAGQYDYGTTVTITATAHNSHSIFTGWSNGETSATTAVTLVSDSSLTANFILDSHTLTASVNDTAMGSVSGAGTYTHGTAVTLTATPAAHHHFVSWSNGLTSPVISVNLVSDSSLTATFALDSHTLTAIPNYVDRGIVTGGGTYNYGDTAVLVAKSIYPYLFLRWDDAASTTSDTLRYVVLHDATVTALFQSSNHDVTVRTNDASMGSVSGGGNYVWGSTVTLTATPAAHHHLVSWSNGATTPVINITVTSDTTLTATFAIDSLNLQVTSNDGSMGTVSGAGRYPYGASVQVSATPAANHHLTSWSNGQTALSYSVTLTTDSFLVANFAIDRHTLALSVNKTSLGSVSGAGIYDHGTVVTITATPADDHSLFTGWSNGVTAASTTVNLVSDSSLTANFILDSHTLNVSVNDTTMGSVSGAGTYTHGTAVTLTATPAAHHHFLSWSNGLTSPVISVNLVSDSSLTATFALDSHTLTAIPNYVDRGIVTGGGTYNYGDTAVLVAKSIYPYLFLRWDDASSTTSDTLRYVVLHDATVTALFQYSNHDVTVRTNDASMGSVSGGGNYVWGSTVTLTATPAAHHHLVSWSNGATTPVINITVTSDTTLTATFAIDSLNLQVASNDASMGSVSGAGRYPYGASVQVTATPAANHHLTSWSNGQTALSYSVTLTTDSFLVANFAIDRHTLALSVNKTSLGYVTGAGIYDHGTVVTITATPADDHSIFTGWSNGVTSATTTVNLLSDSSLTAGFILDTHTISASVNDTAMGSVSGAGTFTHGTLVTLTATPAAHHHFLSWSNGVTSPSFSLVADKDSSVTATFALDTYTITAIPNDPARGTVTGGGSYHFGDTIRLIATAIDPYKFSRWDDPSSSETDTLTYIVRRDTTITAIFIYNELDVIVLSNDGSMGTVSGGGAYVYGTTATLTATPAPHHHLLRWSNGATTPSISFTVLQDTSFTAFFAVDTLSLSLSANDASMGSVSGSGLYPYGTSVTVTATPAAHHHLSSWSNGVITPSYNVVLTSDSSLVANFAIDRFNVALSVNNTSLGSVTGAGTYDYGTPVSISAIPADSHSIFNGWSNGVTTASTTITLLSDTSLMASFVLDSHTISVSVNDSAMGSATGSGTYAHGTSVTLIATPAAHHHFVSWSNGVTTPSFTLRADTDSAVTALFAIDTHTITAIPNDAARGVVTGSGVYNYGDTAVLVATSNYPFVFYRWDDAASTTTDTLRFVVTNDATVTALFQYSTHDVTARPNDGSMGSVSGGGNYVWGTTATLTATPAAHHHLLAWSNGATTPSINVVVTSDTTLTAIFAIDSFSVAVTSSDAAMGSVTGSGLYAYGSSATLTATPAAHHHLVSWSNGATSLSQSLTVTHDTSLVASFAIDRFNVALSVNNTSLGSVTGAGTYDYGTSVSISAIPADSHSIFNGWSNGVTTASTTVNLVSDTSLMASFLLDSHTISVSVNDSAMGSATGSGTYAHGTSVTLIATPAAHHHFVSWSNGVTTPSFTLRADTDSAVTALFAIDTHTITAIPNDAARGVVTGSGVYNYGDTAVLVATSNYPFVFYRWDDAASTTSDTLRFVVTSDATVTALFQYSTHDVTARPNDGSMGSVSGGGNYVWGTTATLTATPAAHHHLLAWSNGATTPSINVVVTSDTTLTAIFAIDSFTVAVTSSDAAMGSVTGSGLYAYGSSATLTATPAAHHHLVSWSNGATTLSQSLTVTHDTSLVASFAIDRFNVALSVNNTSLGSVTGAGTYDYGTPVSISAIPADSHSIFNGWSNGDTARHTTITLLSDTSLMAYFAIDRHTVTTLVNDSSMGTVLGGGTYTHGTSVTLTALPAAHHHFISWSNGVTAASFSLTADVDTVVTALFAIDTYTITAIPNDTARGVVSGSGVYNYGDTAILVATNKYPYVFSRWDDNASTTTDTLRYPVLYGATVTAIFSYSEYEVTALTNDASMGTVSGGGTYFWGDTVTLTATPAAHHHLVGWSNGLTSPAIDIVVTKDTSLTAIFAIDSFDISVSSADPSLGTVTGSGRYPYGYDLLIQAIPEPHHHLVSWNTGSSATSFHLFVNGDSSFVASFAIDRYTVTAVPNEAIRGNVYGSGTYNYGDSITLVAEAIYPYQFSRWDDLASTTEDTISFVVTADTTLTAIFRLGRFTVATASNDTTMGLTSGDGSYSWGSAASLTASPAPYHHLVGWSNGATTNTINLIVVNDTLLTATFAPDSANIQAFSANPAMGSVAGAGRYRMNSTATLVATPAVGHHFVSWSNGSTSDTLSLQVTGDLILIANFAIDQHTVTVNVNDPTLGTASGSGIFNYGSVVNISATPADIHSVFVAWSNGDTNPVTTITLTSDTVVTAIFSSVTCSVTLNTNDSTMGSVSGAGIYNYQQTVLVTAIPAPHHHLVRWSNGATSETISILLDRDTALTAYFAVDRHTVTLNVNNPAMGALLGAGTYDYGSAVTLTALPASPHYLFAGWSNGDTARSTLITLTSDTILTGIFVYDSHTVTALSNDTLKGSVSGSGTFTHGSIAQLIATPADHYHLVSWSNGATTDTINVLVQSDTTITAIFAIDQFVVSAISDDPDRGYTIGSGTYAYGSTVTLMAMPFTYYHFVSWSNGSTSSSISLTVTSDTTLFAYFDINSHTISAIPNDSTMGYTTGSGTYTAGDKVTLTAVPYDGYQFDGWSDGSTSSVLSFYVSDDVSLTAYFSKIPSSVEDVDADDSYVAYVEYHDLVVTDAAGHTITVYDMNGRLVATIPDASDEERVHVHLSGVYIIKVDNLPLTRLVVK